MKEYKSAIRFSFVSLQSQLRNPGLYIVLLVIFFALQVICYDVGDYLHKTNGQMNIFEIYIWFMGSRSTQTIYLLGLIVLVCGCAFFSNGAGYNLIRMKRKTWVFSHIMYMTMIIVLYNIALLISFWVSCKGALTLENRWSEAAYRATVIWIEEIGIRSMMGVVSKTLGYNPNLIGLLTLLLALLVGLFVGMLLLAFMLYGKSVHGIACVCVLWFVDMLCAERIGIAIFRKIFPFTVARTAQQAFWASGHPTLYSVIYFAVMLIVLVLILRKISQKVDFVKME